MVLKNLFFPSIFELYTSSPSNNKYITLLCIGIIYYYPIIAELIMKFYIMYMCTSETAQG